MDENGDESYLRENEENQNRKWTRNPFKSRRYIVPLVTVFTISLAALLAVILIYFMHVDHQEKLTNVLAQRIMDIQDDANRKWKTLEAALRDEIRLLRDRVTEIEEDHLQKIEKRLAEFQELSDIRWQSLSEEMHKVMRQNPGQPAVSATWISFLATSMNFSSSENFHDIVSRRSEGNANSATLFTPTLFVIWLSVLVSFI